jgi:hypothetical protein
MAFVYPFGITAMYAVLLWRQRKAICPVEGKWGRFLCFKDAVPPRLDSTKEEDAITEQRKMDIPANPQLNAIQFLFKEYEPYYWWFEIFECFRRLMLTGGSVIIMEGSATQVVCGTLMALFSIHVYSICQPFVHDDDDVLALGAQWAIFFTLFGGLLLKLQLNGTDGYDKDGSSFGAFLIFVNILVVVVGVSTFIFAVYTTQITSAAGALKSVLLAKLGRATSKPTIEAPGGDTSDSSTSTGHISLGTGFRKGEIKATTTTINPAFQRTPSLRPELTSEPTSVV